MQMYERLSNEARHTLQTANQVASGRGHKFINAQDLFTAIMRHSNQTVLHLLNAVKIDWERLFMNPKTIPTRIEEAPPLKSIIDTAIKEADGLNDEEVDGQHLLLALAQQISPDSDATLGDSGIRVEDLRIAIRGNRGASSS